MLGWNGGKDTPDAAIRQARASKTTRPCPRKRANRVEGDYFTIMKKEHTFSSRRSLHRRRSYHRLRQSLLHHLRRPNRWRSWKKNRRNTRHPLENPF
jgi:hypothetical protein